MKKSKNTKIKDDTNTHKNNDTNNIKEIINNTNTVKRRQFHKINQEPLYTQVKQYKSIKKITKLMKYFFDVPNPPNKNNYSAPPLSFSSITTLLNSVADIFDGLAKNVDILEGEIKYHERLNKIDTTFKKKDKKNSFTGFELYYKDLKKSEGASKKVAIDLWRRESKEIKEKYKSMIEKSEK